MIIESYNVKDMYVALKDSAATVDAYIQPYNDEINLRKLPAMIIFPGGGYCLTCHREGEPVAIEFASRGYQCFIVWYSCAPTQYPQQLLEAAATVAFVRKNAEKFNVDPDRISVMGFSAGGHLAAMSGTLFGDEVVTSSLNEPKELTRPDAMVLCYPVISFGEFAHKGSAISLLGTNKDNKELIHKLSLENAVTPESAPAFIWATVNDSCVPSENSLAMAAALKANGVEFELHLYAFGPHGISMADRQSYAQGYTRPEAARLSHWVQECDGWLSEHFAREEKNKAEA